MREFLAGNRPDANPLHLAYPLAGLLHAVSSLDQGNENVFQRGDDFGGASDAIAFLLEYAPDLGRRRAGILRNNVQPLAGERDAR